VDGGNARALAFTANILQQLNRPTAKTSFFVCAGAGLYSVGVGDLTANGSYQSPFETGTFIIETEGDSQTEFGINFGLGIDTAPGSSASFLLEGRYNMVFTDILGVDNAYFFSVLAGLNFRLGAR
jgi:opacity protein-like surface antigen